MPSTMTSSRESSRLDCVVCEDVPNKEMTEITQKVLISIEVKSGQVTDSQITDSMEEGAQLQHVPFTTMAHVRNQQNLEELANHMAAYFNTTIVTIAFVEMLTDKKTEGFWEWEIVRIIVTRSYGTTVTIENIVIIAIGVQVPVVVGVAVVLVQVGHLPMVTLITTKMPLRWNVAPDISTGT